MTDGEALPAATMGRPVIQAVRWLPARDVLPREADDFTPWLADNLDLLASTLGLESLEKAATENAFGDYRLDILARGVEHDGYEIPVCIENQFGGTDLRQLGQLITYLAQQGSARLCGLSRTRASRTRPRSSSSIGLATTRSATC
jgi:hypothetical protein